VLVCQAVGSIGNRLGTGQNLPTYIDEKVRPIEPPIIDPIKSIFKFTLFARFFPFLRSRSNLAVVLVFLDLFNLFVVVRLYVDQRCLGWSVVPKITPENSPLQ
jgi:hypothetical protein